jgi:hypothetical protein
MRRKIRPTDLNDDLDGIDFKNEVIKDMFYQLDYRTALRRNVVTVSEEEMMLELKKLSTSALVSWYLSYLFIRKELMHAGYELNGFKVLDMPFDTIHELMAKDPEFDLKQYIF